MKFRSKKRPIFGVVAAQAADMEQRQILKGIIEQAQKFNVDIAVFSNIYNPNETDPSLYCENKIYDLILSQELDGIILISESIINTELQQKIKQNLELRNTVPIVVIGTPLIELKLSDLTFINTSDEDDIEDVTNHLIETHGFTDIHILTGHDFLDASHLRVNGYRKALENHGIPFDENKVFFGDFWMNSGEKLAMRYINGELALPEAVVCTNDYMAYGILDKFMEYKIDIPNKVTVVGYEYVCERFYHYPILTTYQRNRKSVGIRAVNLLIEKTTHEKVDVEPMLNGKIICGESCLCGIEKSQLGAELEAARIKKSYDFLNLFCQMDHRLTECKSISDFVKVLHDFMFLIRSADEVYFCLLEKWYDEDSQNDIMNCYKLMEENSKRELTTIDKYDFASIFANISNPAAYYFNPLFFANRIMGYAVVRYDTADTCDHIFRNWLKSVSNSLEFLRMKNDIRYLSQCQNISEYYDSLTGLYNLNGFENAVNYSAASTPKQHKLILIILKTEIFPSEVQFDKQTINISISNEIADALKTLSDSKTDICGRINRSTYACALRRSYDESYANLLTDKLKTLILHKTRYVNEFGMDSFICSCKVFDNTEQFDFKKAFSEISDTINEKTVKHFQKCAMYRYKEFEKFRDNIYLNPTEEVNPEDLCRRLNIGIAHFRHIYKELFEISFNQDCIVSRMVLAKFLLLTTSFDINTVALKCGYSDEKYFMRLFQKKFSFTPSRYRECFYLNQ